MAGLAVLAILALLAVPILLIVFITKTNRLERDYHQLRLDLIRLRDYVTDNLGTTPKEAAKEPEPVPQTETVVPQEEPVEAAPDPAPEEVPTIESLAAKASDQAKPGPIPRARTKEDWEALIGGKLLNRIGALALILGVIFFLKYAFDNNWVTEEMRVAAGALAGITLLVLGQRFQTKGLPVFAQGLVGAGIAILYISVFAAFNFYGLIGQIPAFFLMFAVTATAIIIALKHDALAIALLSWAGGFITPILLSTGQANQVGLFSYIFFLNIALLSILLRKPMWLIIKPLVMAATYFIFAMFLFDHYRSDTLWLTSGFLLLFWLMFFASSVIRSARKHAERLAWEDFLPVANAAVYTILQLSILTYGHVQWLTLLCSILAVAYIGGYYFLSKLDGMARGALNQYTLTAALLLVVAPIFKWENHVLLIIWSVQSIPLMIVDKKYKWPHVRIVGTGLLWVSGALLLITAVDTSLEEFVLITNMRTLSIAVYCFALWWASRRWAESGDKLSGALVTIMNMIAGATIFYWLNAEITIYFDRADWVDRIDNNYAEFITRLVCWALYTVVLFLYARMQQLKSISFSSLGLLTITTLSTMFMFNYVPIESFTVIINRRFFLFVVLIAVIAYILYLHRQNEWPQIPKLQHILGWAIFVVILSLITMEIHSFYEMRIHHVLEGVVSEDFEGVATEYEIRSDLLDQKHLAISGGWILYAVVLVVIGFIKDRAVLRMAGIGLFGIVLLKIIFHDLSNIELAYRIFLFLGLGLVLLLVSYVYQKNRESAAADSAPEDVQP